MGICGYIQKQKITNDKQICDMTCKLTTNSKNAKNILTTNNLALGNNGSKLITRTINNINYTIVYNGNLFNIDELILILQNKGYDFFTQDESEIVLLAYIAYGKDCLAMLNGSFSFAIYNNGTLFLARDRLGIKPLFYYNKEKFIFSSEIKSILAHKDVDAKIGKEEICEIFGLGPAHTPGKTFYKDIYEILPGHYATFENNTFTQAKYWDLDTAEINDTIEESIIKIKTLVTESLNNSIGSNEPICSMLSRRIGL